MFILCRLKINYMKKYKYSFILGRVSTGANISCPGGPVS
jgi:hypothetical protein